MSYSPRIRWCRFPTSRESSARCCACLRPGGRFIASDWLRGGTGAYSPEMMEFFRLEGIAYNMATLEESAAALRAAGFVDVEIRDRHGWYLTLAQRELEAMEGPLKAIIVSQIGARARATLHRRLAPTGRRAQARRIAPGTPESDQAEITARAPTSSYGRSALIAARWPTLFRAARTSGSFRSQSSAARSPNERRSAP